MRYTYDSSIVSDLHKEATGVRPAPDFWAEWNQATADERQYIWDNLLTAAEHAQDLQEQEEQEAIRYFEMRVENLLHAGTDRASTIQLMMEAAGAQGDLEYFEFTQGLPFGYLTKTTKEIV